MRKPLRIHYPALQGLLLGGMLMVSAAMSSCQSSTAPAILQIEDQVRAETLLLSELEAHDVPQDLIRCPLTIKNLTPDSQSVKLIGTGCSCYGVKVNGELLKRGEPLILSSRASLEFNIDAEAPRSESLQEYRVRLEIPTPSGPVERQISCQLQVYQDLKVFPTMLICDTAMGETRSVQREVTIERVYRSLSGDTSSPVISNLPPGVVQIGLNSVALPIELETGIWKAVWNLTLQADVEGTLSSIGTTESYQVGFESTDGTGPITSSFNKIVRRVRVPIQHPRQVHFGSIPTGEKRKRSLFLSHVDGGTFRLNIDTDRLPANVEAFSTEELANRYKIDILVEGLEPGAWKETLRLSTDLGTQPEIQIELNANFVSPATD